MKRFSDWEDRLATYLDVCQERAFAWGSHDCALFAAGAVRAQTGVDPAEAYRGTYTDKRGAAKALAEHGAGRLITTVASWFPAHESVFLAKRGDVVMRDAFSVGVCVGAYSLFVGEEGGREGLVCIPTADCLTAFAVPFDDEEAA